MTENSINSNSIIISLDADAMLFNKLDVLTKANIAMVEINSSEPTLLKKAIQDFPRLQIGAGNIINSQQLEDCCEAGVSFVSSPGFLATLAQTAEIYAIKFIPGVSTISEGMQALAINCHNVKVFPANIDLCRNLNKYLPLLRLFPAAVDISDVQKYLDIPAVAAVSIVDPDVTDMQQLSSGLVSA